MLKTIGKNRMRLGLALIALIAGAVVAEAIFDANVVGSIASGAFAAFGTLLGASNLDTEHKDKEGDK